VIYNNPKKARSMKTMYIFGSGGFSKEVAYLVNAISTHEENDEDYKLGGFLDTNPTNSTLKIGNKEIPMIDEETFFNSFSKNEDTFFSIGIGDPKIREKIFTKYSKQLNFPNLIHPSTTGDFQSIKIGTGNIITAGCCFTVDISIGSSNIFNLNVTVGHDCKIASNNVINPGVNISGSVEIGESSLIGTGATILQELSIGSYSIIGAGSVVTKSVDDNSLAVGLPARTIKKLN
jgi:sugar O-acyltransferase (sialic acid O-acetyltransferase NeuD family)